jgi:hypothetical protein
MAWMWMVLLTLGCGGGDDKSGDTGRGSSATTTPAPTTTAGIPASLLIDDIDMFCEGPLWVFYAHATGWVGDAVVNVWEVLPDKTGWDEEHTMASVGSHPTGEWDEIERRLNSGDYVPDETTLFQCGLHDTSDAMVYAVRIYDLDLNLADCALRGNDADTVDKVATSHTDVSVYNAPSNPSELDGCQVW